MSNLLQQNSERIHHARGMSKWPPLLECAFFEGIGDNKNAELGTKTHEYLQNILERYANGLPTETTEDETMYEQGARRFANKIISDFERLCGDKLMIEHKCIIEQEHDSIFGYCDCAFVSTSDRSINVYDFKTFFNNGRDYTPQLAGYALAISDELKTRQSVEDYRFNLCAGYGDSAELHEETMDRMDAVSIFVKVMNKFDYKKDEKPKQCNWCSLCKHHATCPACIELAEKTETTISSVPRDFDRYTMEMQAQFLALADAVQAWADAVKDKAKAVLIAGGKIEDAGNGIYYKLTRTQGRKTPRTQDAVEMLQAKGVSIDEIKTALKIGASDVKKLLQGVGIKGKAQADLLTSVSDIGECSVRMVKG